MFTQCSNCHTVFRLSAETLRAAGGQVRCGRCGDIFNALTRLAEEPGAFPRRESPLEMEMRADEILRSDPTKMPAAGADEFDGAEMEDDEDAAGPRDVARLQIIDSGAAATPTSPGTSLDAPLSGGTVAPLRTPAAPVADSPLPGTTRPRAEPVQDSSPSPAASVPRAESRQAATPSAAPSAPSTVSIETPPAAHPVAMQPSASTPPKPAATSEPAAEESFEFTLPPGELDRVFVEVPPRSRAPIPAAGLALSEAAVEKPAGIASEARRHRLSVGADAVEDLIAPARRPRSYPVWVAAAAALALVLVGQIVHDNRSWLANHAPLRGPLRGLYATLGIAVQVPADLSVYQLRQWGVTGDPAAAGTLKLRASILNTAAQLQPYPLLRVTLANRFGARIGARDFEPAEYLGKPSVRMLAPGERADATLAIVDPGKDAEGFEIDVCLRGAGQQVACSGDAAQRAPP